MQDCVYLEKACFWKFGEKLFISLFNESITCISLLYVMNYINYKWHFYSPKQEVQRDSFLVSANSSDLAMRKHVGAIHVEHPVLRFTQDGEQCRTTKGRELPMQLETSAKMPITFIDNQLAYVSSACGDLSKDTSL